MPPTRKARRIARSELANGVSVAAVRTRLRGVMMVGEVRSCRHLHSFGAPEHQMADLLKVGFGAGKDGEESTVVDDADAVADREEFVEFGGDEEDRFAGVGL